MNVVYMGTPDFAVPALQALVDAGHKVSLVVAKADQPKDRGKKLKPCPVKEKALELGLEVETPLKLRKNAELHEKIRALNPDLIVVAAYGMILPKAILDIPKYGCVNIHGSILPKYRGAAPIQRAVLDGEAETGVTLMYMAEALDAGDMIAVAKTPIDQKTSDELFDELAVMGAKLLIEQMPLIEAGTAGRTPQDESLVSHAAMVSKEEGKIDFSAASFAVECKVRGMNSWPSAYCSLNEQTMKVHKARAQGKCSAAQGKEPGTILAADKKGLLVACGQGEAILFTNIQMPGKKAMDVSAFLLGNKIEIGTVLR